MGRHWFRTSQFFKVVRNKLSMRYSQSTDRSGRYLARLFRIGVLSTERRYVTEEVVAAPYHLLKEASQRTASGILFSLCLLLQPWYPASYLAVSKPTRGHSQGVCYGHLKLANCSNVRRCLRGRCGVKVNIASVVWMHYMKVQ